MTLFKHPKSKYWSVRLIQPNGRATNRSTKQTDRDAAVKVAFTMQAMARAARDNELTQGAVTKWANDLAGQIGAPALKRRSIAQHCQEWLAGGKWSDATRNRYRPVLTAFLKHLGARQNAALSSLTPAEIESFRNAEERSGKGATTANFAVKVLRGVFAGPARLGEIQTNPARAVEIRKARKQERQPFTAPELSNLLAAARGTDWEGMILIGGHCGIRLADCAHLTWGSIDMDGQTIEFVPSKTGERVRLALHPEVEEWLKSRGRGIGKAPLFPTLCGHRTGSAGGLSNAFSKLMDKAGVIVPEGPERKGKGRRFRAKGFHALRHTMISRMANADVSQDVRRAIAGHASDAAHERYVHLKVDTQRRAVDKMPRLGK